MLSKTTLMLVTYSIIRLALKIIDIIIDRIWLKNLMILIFSALSRGLPYHNLLNIAR